MNEDFYEYKLVTRNEPQPPWWRCANNHVTRQRFEITRQPPDRPCWCGSKVWTRIREAEAKELMARIEESRVE